MITLTREEAQQVLDALKHLCAHTTAIKGYDGHKVQPPINMLKAKLKQPKNSFNPDWEAMAVMVEEQQRMAKRIEELTQLVTSQGIRLMDAEAQPEQMTSSSIARAREVARLLRKRNIQTWDDIDREAVFAIDALVSFASMLLNHRLNSVRAQPEPMIDGYPLYSGLPKPEPEPVAWTVGGLITDFSRDFSAYKTKTYTQPLYTTPPQRKPEPEPVAWMLTELDGTPLIDCGDLVVKPRPILVGDKTDCIPLYTAPPQREWVGMTNDELLDIADMAYANDLELLQTLQAKLKDKNGF